MVLGEMLRAYEQLRAKIPTYVGREAENFFKQSFRQQGFSGASQSTWRARKGNTDPGRAILVKTGKLRNSIRILEVSDRRVVVGSELPYAEAHNEGLKATVQVGEHSRVATRKVFTRYTKKGKGTGRKSKIRGRGFQVRAHQRNVNLPKRQFIGPSPYLDKRIERLIEARLRQIFN